MKTMFILFGYVNVFLATQKKYIHLEGTDGEGPSLRPKAHKRIHSVRKKHVFINSDIYI
jgi:hypothetical protein